MSEPNAEYECPACYGTGIIGAESNPGRRYCSLCTAGAQRVERDRAQRAYNALCSAEASLDGLTIGQHVRGRLAEIRKALGDDPAVWPRSNGSDE